MKKRIIIGIILFILFALTTGILYLNNVYLPVKLKSSLIETLSQKLDYDVEIGAIKYNPFRGIIIKDILIYEQIKDAEHTILSVEEVRFKFLFLPIFKERKFIIPLLHIDYPKVFIRYEENKTSNISSLIIPDPGGNKEHPDNNNNKPAFSFLVHKIDVSSATISFCDRSIKPDFIKVFENVNIGVNIKPDLKISFLIEGRFPTKKGAFTKFNSEGKYNMKSKELDAKISLANLRLVDFSGYINMIPFSTGPGAIKEADLIIKTKDNILLLAGTVNAESLTLRKWDLALNAGVSLEGDFKYNLDKKESDYNLKIGLDNAELQGLKYIDKMSEINGDIFLKKDRLYAENIKMKVLDSNVVLKGELSNFSEPQVQLRFNSDQANLEKIFSVFLHPKNLKLTGTAKASFSMSGALKKTPFKKTYIFDITGAKLESSSFKERLSNIKGYLKIDSDEVIWHNLSFDFLKTSYTTSGKLIELKEPDMDFKLTGKNLNIESKLKIKDGLISIKNIDAKSKESYINLSGKINTRDNKLDADLSLKSNLRTLDLKKFLPKKILDSMNKMKVETTLNISGSLNGNIKDYKNLNASLKIKADSFSIYNLKFNNLAFNLMQKNRRIKIPRLSAKSYSGSLNIEADFDLKKRGPGYQVKMISSGIDLAKLKMDTDFKNKDITGLLNIEGELYGNTNKIETMKGLAVVSVKNGNLWQLDLFKGLGEFFLMPDYRNIVFDQAEGNFTIGNKTVITDNFGLKSKQLTLMSSGKCGFDGNLDFTVYSKLNKKLIRDSVDIRKFTTAIFGELRSALAIKINGTIEKPKYSLVPMPLELLKNIKDFFLGNE